MTLFTVIFYIGWSATVVFLYSMHRVSFEAAVLQLLFILICYHSLNHLKKND